MSSYKQYGRNYDRIRWTRDVVNCDLIRANLASQTAVFDQIFLEDYTKAMRRGFFIPIKSDVRFLPLKLRKRWVRSKRHNTKLAGIIQTRVEAWLKTLPNKQRKQERKLRFHYNFFGRHKTVKWNSDMLE